MPLVFNASPVIVLAKAGLLDAILLIGDLVKIPQAVVDEIQRVDDPNDPARLWFEGSAAPFALIATPSMPPFLVAWDLGLGESAVIAAASSIPGAVAVLDDLAASAIHHVVTTQRWTPRRSGENARLLAFRRIAGNCQITRTRVIDGQPSHLFRIAR